MSLKKCHTIYPKFYFAQVSTGFRNLTDRSRIFSPLREPENPEDINGRITGSGRLGPGTTRHRRWLSSTPGNHQNGGVLANVWPLITTTFFAHNDRPEPCEPVGRSGGPTQRMQISPVVRSSSSSSSSSVKRK